MKKKKEYEYTCMCIFTNSDRKFNKKKEHKYFFYVLLNGFLLFPMMEELEPLDYI